MVKDFDLAYGLHRIRDLYLDYHPEFKNKKILFIDIFSMNLVEEDEQPDRICYRESLDPNRDYENDLKSFIDDHPKYSSTISAFNHFNLKLRNQSIRRKCKGGILWATSRNHTVHFFLDGIDMNIITKKAIKLYPNTVEEKADRILFLREFHHPKDRLTKYRGITGSELRFCYRNWAMLKNHVKFWNLSEMVVPPWESDPALFSRNHVQIMKPRL